MTIPYYGPKQIQLKNGFLLMTNNNKRLMEKIFDNDYKYKKEIIFNDADILYIEELSNDMLAFV